MESRHEIATLMEDWLDANADRLSNRFEIERVGDWTSWNDNGIALDILNNRVVGRVTAWPKNSEVDWPFADGEALDGDTGKQLFHWSFQEFSIAFLDRWLEAVEGNAGNPRLNGK